MRNSSLRPRSSHNSSASLNFEPQPRPSQQIALELQLASARLEVGEIYREFYEAAQMQRSLSGPRMLRRGRFEITAELFPVRNLSGDFFSISDRGPNTTLLAVGDICGKGLLAGMWFTHVLGLVRAYGESAPDPGAALKAINHHLCSSTLKPPLTSLFLASLDHDRGELRYSNAGHPAPVLISSTGTLQMLNNGGPVLGAVADPKFENGVIRLHAGDALVQYTDGLIECRNDSGEEFGLDRLLAESRKTVGSSASEMLFSLIGAAQDFAGTRSREDDCTLMVIRCNELANE